ncbi:MAG TPA: hypothetical protein VLE89_03950 [Chlamydiales bacterium]|nr:hypothetical protein [Chlamydiales bacterium]
MASFFAGMAREEWEEQSTRINKVVIGMILGFVGGGTGGAFVGAIRHAIWGARDIALFWFTPDVVSQVVTVSLASITGIGFVRLVN